MEFVLADDLQACSHRESNYGDERIAKPNVVYVVITSDTNQLAGDLVRA
jgi:hypothetical protein